MIFGAEKSNLKKSLLGGTGIDCFEPIFGFLIQFCFQKHMSHTWDPKVMFSAPSGRSVRIYKRTANLIQILNFSPPTRLFCNT